MSCERAVNLCFQGFVVSKEPRAEGPCRRLQPTHLLSQPTTQGLLLTSGVSSIFKISRAFVQVAALRWLLLYQVLFALLPKDASVPRSSQLQPLHGCLSWPRSVWLCPVIFRNTCFTLSWQPLHQDELLTWPVRAYTLQSMKVMYHNMVMDSRWWTVKQLVAPMY